MIGTLLVIAGGIVALVGGIMVLIEAFSESFWWGLGSLLLWPVQLVFVVTHWAQSKKGFLTAVAGSVIMVLGFLAIPTKAPARARQEASAVAPQSTTHATFEQVTASISDREEVKPQPRQAPKQVAAPAAEEPPQPTIAKVYADNSTKLYYPADCATHPENAYLISKALAVSQGYKEAPCTPKR